MANDPKLGPPQASGPKPIVKYALIGGGLIVAYLLYKRYQSSGGIGAGTAATTTAAPGTSFAVDPSTGVPINPTTGQDFGQIASASPSIGTWTSSAYNALVGAGVDPGAASGALYNYTNGTQLDSTQGGIIDRALGLVGQAPGDSLPFNPLPPVITPPIVKAPTPTGGPPAVSKTVTALQQFVNDVYANMHNPLKAKSVNPANAALAEADVKKGLAALPVGYTAPSGYVLNPATRLLSPAPVKKAA